MLKLFGRAALAATLAFSPLAVLRAEGVVDHVPPDALGFAIMRDVGATNAKFERLIKIFEGVADALPPAPVTYFKAVTGLGAGIDESGDAVLALLPGDDPTSPKLMFLAPVSDYAAFAQSIGGDPTGEISRVTITGEEVLVARQGDYALVMNVEHRPTMEAQLASASDAADEKIVPAEWLIETDVAVVVLPAGVDALVAMGRAGLAAEQQMWEEEFGDPVFADQLASLKSTWAIYDEFLGFCDAEISAGVAGVSIDEATNVKLTQRMLFKRDGQMASLTAVERSDASPLAGLAAKPFVYAVGGPVLPSWRDGLAAMCRTAFKESGEAYGFQDFDDAQWKKLEEALQNIFAVRSVVSAIYSGEKDDPLYSNVYLLAQVDDAPAYLQSARSSVETWNELTAASTSDIKLIYELSEAEVAGKPALLMTVDVLAAAGDENVPMVRPMFQAMFGADGKLRIYLAAADEHTIVGAIATEERAAAAVENALKGGTELVDSPETQTTTALLDPDAAWVGYMSPPGWASWFRRLLDGVLLPLGGVGITLPEYPAGPPVGYAVRLADGQLHIEAAAPVKMLEDLAAFIKAMAAL
jgi:hypothetical protein